MQLEIKTMLGIAEADLVLHKGVTEIVGRNESGKTSLAVVLQALLSHSPNPLSLSGAQRVHYVRDGAGEGVAKLTLSAEGSAEWRPKVGSVEAPAQSRPVSSAAAVGLVSFTDRATRKEKALRLQSVLLPDAEVVIAAVRKALSLVLSAEECTGVCASIRARGWEATATLYADRARQAKQHWRAITGKPAWGGKVGSNWIPSHWQAGWEAETVQAVEGEIVQARDQLAALHREEVVSEHQANAARAAQEQLPQLETDSKLTRKTAEEAADALGAAQVEAQAARERAKARGAEYRTLEGKEAEVDILVCPHCSGKVSLGRLAGSAVLVEVENRKPASPDQLMAAHKALAEAKDVELAAFDQVKEKNREHSEAVAAYGAAKERAKAAHSAAQAADIPIADAGRDAQLASAEQAVSQAEAKLEAIRSYRMAGEYHKSIVEHNHIAAQIGPRGVRASWIEQGLRKFNAGLAVICDVAGWPLAVMDKDGGLRWGERPIELCTSESARWRAQAACQLTAAAMLGSQWVVLDRADLLDATNWQGLTRSLDRVRAKLPELSIVVVRTGPPEGEFIAGWNRIVVQGGTARNFKEGKE